MLWFSFTFGPASSGNPVRTSKKWHTSTYKKRMYKRGCSGTLHFLGTLNPGDPRSYSIQNSCFSCIQYTRINSGGMGTWAQEEAPPRETQKQVQCRGGDWTRIIYSENCFFFEILREKKRSIVHNRHFALKVVENNKTEQSFWLLRFSFWIKIILSQIGTQPDTNDVVRPWPG